MEKSTQKLTKLNQKLRIQARIYCLETLVAVGMILYSLFKLL